MINNVKRNKAKFQYRRRVNESSQLFICIKADSRIVIVILFFFKLKGVSALLFRHIRTFSILHVSPGTGSLGTSPPTVKDVVSHTSILVQKRVKVNKLLVSNFNSHDSYMWRFERDIIYLAAL
jgi:hypothetical protein